MIKLLKYFCLNLEFVVLPDYYFFSVVLPDYSNFGDFTDPGVVRKYKWRVVLPDYSWVCIKSRVGVVRKYNFLGLYILTTPALLYNWTQE